MNIVSFGGGTNSAALLIGLYKHKIPIDLITFADTGAEHPHTYQFIEIINQWLVLLQKMSEGISIPHPVARRMAGCFRSYKIFRSFFRRWSNLA